MTHSSKMNILWGLPGLRVITHEVIKPRSFVGNGHGGSYGMI